MKMIEWLVLIALFLAAQVLRENLVLLFSKYLKESINGVLTEGKIS